jgi:hypothetical protein
VILIKRESASHWYLPDGTPYHDVPRADGNGTRSVTLRDARKVNALPSVTNILSVLSKPGLDAWKQEQAIMAALTLPKRDDESLDAFARRVVTDMSEQVRSAADLGSAVHAAIEVYLQTGEPPENPDILRLFEPVKLWIDEHIERIGLVEAVAVHSEFGYAGRIDLVAKLKSIGTWAVIDFKTQKTRRDKAGNFKPLLHDTWPLQLEAYRQALICRDKGLADAAIASVVIGSTEPVPVVVKVWDDADKAGFFRAFLAARDLWVWQKNYCPVKEAGLATAKIGRKGNFLTSVARNIGRPPRAAST